MSSDSEGLSGISLSEFDFDLPERLIALRPERPRRAARMLVWNSGAMSHRSVSDLAELLRPGDHLVFNNTRVIPAALRGTRTRPGSGGTAGISINLDRMIAGREWNGLARPAKRLRAGDLVEFGGGLSAAVLEQNGASVVLRFNCKGEEFRHRLGSAGTVPLPPYIVRRRLADAQDSEDYQTVFAKRPGAVAAPTASLHFDNWLLKRLERSGIGHSEVTLHVGAGTFLPIRDGHLSCHRMHSEWGEISPSAADRINSARSAGGRIIPVGTTALRLLETAQSGVRFILGGAKRTSSFVRGIASELPMA